MTNGVPFKFSSLPYASKLTLSSIEEAMKTVAINIDDASQGIQELTDVLQAMKNMFKYVSYMK
jgi:hypothetical protein